MDNWEQPEIQHKSAAKQVGEFLLEITRIILISLAIIIPIRYYLIQPFYVKGASMEPNFHDHEYLLIDEISYRFRIPERGEVVVFRFPLDRSQYFIKRIIGLPGETVEIKDGHIYIYNNEYKDGFQLDEDEYLASDLKTNPLNSNRVELKDDEYFVMGDNRPLSLDSREFGSVQGDLIVGRAILRGYPFDRVATFFEPPQYNL